MLHQNPEFVSALPRFEDCGDSNSKLSVYFVSGVMEEMRGV